MKSNTLFSLVFAAGAVALASGCQSSVASPQGAGVNASTGGVAADIAAASAPMPTVHEKATLTYAPNVPPPITRRSPAIVDVTIDSRRQVMTVAPNATYEYWTFDGHVPGPFIRTRVGDTLHLTLTDHDPSGMPHSIDFHAVNGPGGGMMVTMATPDEPAEGYFRLLEPGLFLYHCGTPPVMDHLANGMYGLLLVEPAEGLPKVDHEYYIMQSEVYAELGKDKSDPTRYVYSHADGLDEKPRWVVFNGAAGSMIGDGQLAAQTGEQVRLFVGNAGPNLTSSFHVIGSIMSAVYREGNLSDPPSHHVQTTTIPAGGASVVEFKPIVPGDYTFVDHAIFRVEKGAAGRITVKGAPRPDIIVGGDDLKSCTNCLAHPGNS